MPRPDDPSFAPFPPIEGISRAGQRVAALLAARRSHAGPDRVDAAKDWRVASVHPGTTAVAIRLRCRAPERAEPDLIARLAREAAPSRVHATESAVLSTFGACRGWPGPTCVAAAEHDLLLVAAGGIGFAPGDPLDAAQAAATLEALAALAGPDVVAAHARWRADRPGDGPDAPRDASADRPPDALPVWGAGSQTGGRTLVRRLRLFRRRVPRFLDRLATVVPADHHRAWARRLDHMVRTEEDERVSAELAGLTTFPGSGPGADSGTKTEAGAHRDAAANAIGLVHGDLHAANVFVGPYVTIIDWGRASTGPPLLDPLRLLVESTDLDAAACDRQLAAWARHRRAWAELDAGDGPVAGDEAGAAVDPLADRPLVAESQLMSLVIGYGPRREIARWEWTCLARAMRPGGPLDD